MTDQTTTERAPRKGDTVYVRTRDLTGYSTEWVGSWTVERVNDRSYSLTQPATGKTLRCGKTMVTLTAPTEQEAAEAAAGVQTIPFRTPWYNGTIVRWTNAPREAGTSLFVVIKDDGLPMVSVAPLGNAAGLRGRAPVALLTKVEPSEILKPGAAD